MEVFISRQIIGVKISLVSRQKIGSCVAASRFFENFLTLYRANRQSIVNLEMSPAALCFIPEVSFLPSDSFQLSNGVCVCEVVVDRRNYSRIFQFPLRINVKISEYAQNFNVFKPRLVCRRILILPSGSSGNSQKSEILKNLKFSKI